VPTILLVGHREGLIRSDRRTQVDGVGTGDHAVYVSAEQPSDDERGCDLGHVPDNSERQQRSSLGDRLVLAGSQDDARRGRHRDRRDRDRDVVEIVGTHGGQRKASVKSESFEEPPLGSAPDDHGNAQLTGQRQIGRASVPLNAHDRDMKGLQLCAQSHAYLAQTDDHDVAFA
jgi:hypothetical protein